MHGLLSGSVDGNPTIQQSIILESIGESCLEATLQQIENGEWGMGNGETTLLPVLVQALNILVSDFSGLAVMMPSHSLSSTPIFIVFQPDGQYEEVSDLPSNLPLLIFDGIDHWMHAEPLHSNPAGQHAIGSYGGKAVMAAVILRFLSDQASSTRSQ